MQGRNNSRHRAVDAKVEERIRNLLLAGHSVTEVMQRTGYGRTVVYRIKAALNEIAAEQRGQMRSVGKR